LISELFLATEAGTSDTLNELGALELSDWLWAGGLLAISVAVALVARRLVIRLTTPQLTPFVAKLIARLSAALVFILGFFYALQQVGVSLTPLLGLLGLFGLAVAFAFQEVLENFIAGFFLSARRPFAQGDEITTADIDGVVEDISLRELRMRTYEGELVYIPNASVWRNAIINRTALRMRRTSVTVGVAYGTSLEEAGRVLTDTLGQVEGVAPDPPPQALAFEFGDSSINYSLRFWHDAPSADKWVVRDRVVKATHRALADAGIEIPFPQRTVSFKQGPTGEAP